MAGFTFHESYDETFQQLEDAERLQLIDAMRDYAFRGVEPDFSDRLMAVTWGLMAPNIDASMKKSKSNAKRNSRRDSMREPKPKPTGNKHGFSHENPCENPESIGTEWSGVDGNPSSNEEEGSPSTTPSGTGAAAAKAAPPLPAGWERTGVVCSHASCDLLQIRDPEGALWCPGCDLPELSMMGVVA